MKIRQYDLCLFCDKETESITNLSWECESALRFWKRRSLLVSETNVLRVYFNQLNILFGISKVLLSVNYLILMGKYYIYKCKWLGIIPKIKGFIQHLKFKHDIEKCMASSGTNKRYENTWTTLKSVHVQNFGEWQAVSLGGGVTVMEKREIFVGWVTKVCLKCTKKLG